MIKLASNILYTILIATLVAVAGFFVATLLPLPGNAEVKIVKSGSMEPAIPTGSVVVIAPARAYVVGDVITFGEDSPREVPTTHRIVAVEGVGERAVYTTKGDANEEPDVAPVAAREVIGRVWLHVPYAGFVLDFARKPMGFALLIGLPALLIIFDELLTIWGEVRRLRGKTRGEKSSRPSLPGYPQTFPPDFSAAPTHSGGVLNDIRIVRSERPPQHYPARKLVMGLVASIGLMGGTAFGHIGATVSYLGDIERSLGNILGAGIWTDPNDPQNIVLNEFLPNPDDEANGLNFGDDGSNMPFGEWVELYNNGDAPMNIFGWYITDASGGGGNTHAFITGTTTNTGDTIIPAHGWIVVYMNKPTLNNTGDTIALYTNLNVEVDAYTYDNPSDFCENEPTPGNQNNGSGSGTPGNGPDADCPQNQVAENKSYARIPDGTGAFVDPIPTPGTQNIADEPVQTFAPFTVVEEGDTPPADEADTPAATDVPEAPQDPQEQTPEQTPTPEVLGVEETLPVGEQDSAPAEDPAPTDELKDEALAEEETPEETGTEGELPSEQQS